MHVNSWIHSVVWYWRHLNGRYKAEECDAIKYFLEPDQVCIDIGAHAGSWTVPLACLVPRGRVYAFEALPHYARALRGLAVLKRLRNVTVYNSAISDKTEMVKIAWRTTKGRRLTGNTHLATESELPGMECIGISAVTLDQWSSEHPDVERCTFVKIDVEGAELLVLKGALRLIGRIRPVIFMEVVTECCARYKYTPDDLFDLFANLGYNAFTIGSEGGRATLRKTSSSIYAGKGDVLIVPRERELPKALYHPLG